MKSIFFIGFLATIFGLIPLGAGAGDVRIMALGDSITGSPVRTRISLASSSSKLIWEAGLLACAALAQVTAEWG